MLNTMNYREVELLIQCNGYLNGNVTKYIYSATGEKLRTIYQTAVPNITVAMGSKHELTDAEVLYKDSVDYYHGGKLTVKNGRLDKCYFDGGYAQAYNAFLCVAKPSFIYDEEPTEEDLERFRKMMESWRRQIEEHNNTDAFSFHYYTADHLGNIREVVNEDGAVEQITNYYPFGTPFAEEAGNTNPDLQNHKYNGKEFDTMHGLNTNDYGARQYNSLVGRWDRMDPLCEKYYSISPYAYCANNPIMLVDEGGQKIELASNCSPEFIKQYNMAVGYLKNNGAADVYEKLDALPDVVTINEYNGSANYALGSEIFWNPLSAMFVISNNEPHLLTPAIRLLHEIGHQYQKLSGGEYDTKDDGTVWQSKEEKRNILEVETPAAIKCGEIPDGTISRDSHSGVGYDTKSSISTNFANPENDNVQYFINFWGLKP